MNDTPDWTTITAPDGRAFEAGIVEYPGYDCREGCIHTPPVNGHGRRNDQWRLCLRHERAALVLRCGTPFLCRKDTDAPMRGYDEMAGFDGWDLALHAEFPIELASIQNNEPGSECCYTRSGRCYGAEGSGLAADECLRNALALGWKPSLECNGTEPIWPVLIAAFDERYADALACHQHVQAFMQCPHCHGVGTVRR